MEAATQPRDGCAAGMKNWPGTGRTPTKVSRLPNRHRGSKGSTPRPAHATGRRLSHRGGHRESEAQSLRSDPWAAVRRAKARSYAAGPGFGDGNPPGFSARNAGKARSCVNYPPNRPANGRLPAGFRANPTRITRAELAPFSPRLSSRRKPAPEPSLGPTLATATEGPNAAALASPGTSAYRRGPSNASWSVPCARSP